MMATKKRPQVRTYRDSQGRQQTQYDAVAFGSETHARLLGLRKEVDGDPFTHEGWALENPTQYGASAEPWFIKQKLAERVSELTTPMPVLQSEDRWEDNYAPPMFDPDGGNTRIVAG